MRNAPGRRARKSRQILTRDPASVRARRMNLQSRIVKVGKLSAHYLLAGPNPGHQERVPLIFLHGGGETARAWRWVMPSLAGRHPVLALDLPGSGRSDLVNGSYTAGFYGRFVRGFLDALDISQAVLVGHSLGGLVAIQAALACEHGDRGRVQALALVASAGLGREVNPILKVLTLPVLGDWSAFLAHHAPRPAPAPGVAGLGLLCPSRGRAPRLVCRPVLPGPGSRADLGPARRFSGPDRSARTARDRARPPVRAEHPNPAPLGRVGSDTPGLPRRGRHASAPPRSAEDPPRLRPHAASRESQMVRGGC